MEILGCPHCDRLFRTSPAVLGKKIRCRGCKQIFYVPRDTSSVPLVGDVVAVAANSRPAVLPLAVACLVGGRDARRCPDCGRTFAMKPAFAGKVIRCRGCRVSFRVLGTESVTAEPRKPVSDNHQPAFTGQLHQPPRPVPRAPLVSPPRPTIFEDIGDVLDDLLPGERVASVVRPRNAADLSSPSESPAAQLVAIILGAACAIPLTFVLLWWVSPIQFKKVAAVMPEPFSAWLR